MSKTTKRFKLVGLNKYFREVWFSDVITTEDLLSGNYLSFFSLSNRGGLGNCDYYGEIQSIGFNDSKGVEIFESDIVYDSTCDVEYEIVFIQGYGFCSSCGQYIPTPDLGDCLTIIGNSYNLRRP